MTDIVELEALSAEATQGEWELQDGCSWRRIGTARHDGDVLCPSTYSTKDNHPDLTARDGRLYPNLRFIVALVNAYRAGELVPAARIAADRARIEALEGVLNRFLGGDIDVSHTALIYNENVPQLLEDARAQVQP